MLDKWKEEYATNSLKELKAYAAHSATWRKNAMKLESSRYGQQFSADEEAQILAFRQAPLPISVSTAIADTADAFMLSAKPSIKTVPIMHPFDDNKNNVSKQVAQLYTYLIQKSWYDSLGNLQFQRVVRDQTNVGHGLLYVVPRHEFGEFNVDIKHLSWRYYYPDPSSVEPLYDDMDSQFYALRISEKAGFKYVKSLEPDITFEQYKEYFVDGSDSVFGLGEEDGKYTNRRKGNESTVLFMHHLTLEDNYSYVVVPKNKDLNTQGIDFGYKTYTEMTPELDDAIRKGNIEVKRVHKISLVEYTSIGRLGFKKVYPIGRYNIVPLVYDHRDNPFPYSRMWYLYPLQRALNKFIMSAILNMSILNSTRVIAEEHSIVDMKEFTMSSSMPGSVLRYRLPVPGVSLPPQVIDPKPMSEAWLVMPRWITSMMEYVSGIYSTMQGNPDGAPDVFSTVASLQSAGGIKFKQRMAAADATLSVVGKITGEFYKDYAPLNGFTTRRNETGEEEPVMFNRLMMDEEMGTDGNKKRTIKIDPNSDLSVGFKDIRFVTESSNGYEAATQVAMLTNLATQLKMPGLAPLILELLNIPGTDKAMKNVDQAQATAQQLQQAQEVISQLEGKAQIFQNQIFQLAKTVEVEKVKGNLKVLVEKAQQNPEEFLNILNQTTAQADAINQNQMQMNQPNMMGQ